VKLIRSAYYESKRSHHFGYSASGKTRIGCDVGLTDDQWRIDDLAQRSGVSVDTIRFWQRHGLLTPPKRVGRTAHYGKGHLDRLVQIRDLQGRHLSLAAIKQVLDSSRVALAGTLFGSQGGDHTRTQLADLAGLPLDLVLELQDVGLLTDPVRLGRESYDDSDLGVLKAVSSLLGHGIPRAFVVRLCQIYSDGFTRMQQEVLSLFRQPSDDMADVDLGELHSTLAARAQDTLHPVETILEYRHQRTVQLMSLESSLTESPDVG
jgi:DNA-binding transcriptional MerR regulator